MSSDDDSKKVSPGDAFYNIGKRVSEFYKATLQNGVEADVALEMTKELIRQMTLMSIAQSQQKREKPLTEEGEENT